jgi:hypothetical protein
MSQYEQEGKVDSFEQIIPIFCEIMPKHFNNLLLPSSITHLMLLLSVVLSGTNCQMETAPKQPQLVFDFDLDGVADKEDLDDDNDGIPVEIELTNDIDGDNIPNHQDRDSDNDGINDLIEALGVDKDGDGMIDPWDEWSDSNHNGFHDEYEVEPLVVQVKEGNKNLWQSHNEFSGISLDLDGDQIPNFWDLDSDDDGVNDYNEWGGLTIKTKIVDTNADGFDDRLIGHIYTQGDKETRSGHPEEVKDELDLFQSIYKNEAQDGVSAIDADGNGKPNFFDKLMK